ncbi:MULTISPECIES: hypothetical protein [Serratia]|uniref:Uncharacterized protein n=1 Tax=Serratia surfactantfaciens TaxID=2741499 RepID=A0ABS0LYQ3_9GAMM|nr:MULTISPECIES: hypothetical protein [Serratia]MBH1919784.1 hypothetical protein [Serratia surfactantfaciens]MBI6153095.1 hypothetical protein [Serratia surfactantfaciens]MTD07346.1 hypothetical protein [Serratia sp. YC16]
MRQVIFNQNSPISLIFVMISEGNNTVITGSFVAIMMKNAASGPDRLSIPAFSVYHARSKNFHWRNWFELHLISGHSRKLRQSFPVAVLSALAHGIE